jgi:hypothetical protein
MALATHTVTLTFKQDLPGVQQRILKTQEFTGILTGRLPGPGGPPNGNGAHIQNVVYPSQQNPGSAVITIHYHSMFVEVGKLRGHVNSAAMLVATPVGFKIDLAQT